MKEKNMAEWCRVGVNNQPDEVCKFIVARFDETTHALWYYGSWDDLKKAREVAEEFYNGIVVERID